jgi:hypothetical protein
VIDLFADSVIALNDVLSAGLNALFHFRSLNLVKFAAYSRCRKAAAEEGRKARRPVNRGHKIAVQEGRRAPPRTAFSLSFQNHSTDYACCFPFPQFLLRPSLSQTCSSPVFYCSSCFERPKALSTNCSNRFALNGLDKTGTPRLGDLFCSASSAKAEIKMIFASGLSFLSS